MQQAEIVSKCFQWPIKLKIEAIISFHSYSAFCLFQVVSVYLLVFLTQGLQLEVFHTNGALGIP